VAARSSEPVKAVAAAPEAVVTGGAVANVGVALHRLGVRVKLIARVGPDLFGRAVLESLASLSERLVDGIAIAAEDATSYTLVINPPGVDRSFMRRPGANESFSSRDVAYEQLAGVRVFHFGYRPLMPRMYADGGAELQTIFARVDDESGAATALDLCQPHPDRTRRVESHRGCALPSAPRKDGRDCPSRSRCGRAIPPPADDKVTAKGMMSK
jgi:sugar/nucleoside kinase (ribokinase family)